MSWRGGCRTAWTGLLPGGAGRGAWSGSTGDFQHRQGSAVHEPRVHGTVGDGRRGDQHGWTRASAGQRVRGATVALGEVRGGLLEGLRERRRVPCRPGGVLEVLLR